MTVLPGVSQTSKSDNWSREASDYHRDYLDKIGTEEISSDIPLSPCVFKYSEFKEN